MNKAFKYLKKCARNIGHVVSNLLFGILIIFTIILYETKRFITNLFKK